MWSQVRRYLYTMRKFRMLILLTTVVVTAFAGLRVSQMPKLYRSVAVIEVQSRAPSVVPSMQYERGAVPYWSFDEFINTQTKIIRSTGVARRVIETMGLDGWTAEGLLSMVRVEAINDSRLIQIIVEGPDPNQAADIAMAFAQSFMDAQFEKQVRRSKMIIQWLEDRIEEIQTDLQRSQEQKFKFAQQERIVSLEDRRNVLLERLDRVERAYSEVRNDRIAKEGIWRQLQRVLDSEQIDSPRLSALIAVDENDRGSAALGDLHRAMADRAELAEVYGPNHPKLAQAQAKVDTLQARLEFEVEKVVESAKIAWEVALSKEQALRRELDTLTSQNLDFNETWLEYSSLVQDVRKNEQIYDTLLQRIKEADVTRNLQNEVAQLVEAAVPNMRHFSPNARMHISVGLLVGLLIGIALAFFYDYLDPKIKFASEFTRLTSLPVLVEIPFAGEQIRDEQERDAYVRKIVHLEPASPEAELFRVLRTQILFGGKDKRPLRSLVVTGVHPKEGKSTVSSNLGISIASMDKRVLLVDADIRRASLSKNFECTDEPGLSEVLSGQADWQSVIQMTDIPNLYIVPAGALTDKPSELMVSNQLSRLLHNWQTEFDHIIIDMAPILAVSDALSFAANTEGILLVLKPESSTKVDIEETIERLRGVDANILGAVFNQVQEGDISANPYYYYYRTGHIDSEL